MSLNGIEINQTMWCISDILSSSYGLPEDVKELADMAMVNFNEGIDAARAGMTSRSREEFEKGCECIAKAIVKLNYEAFEC